MDKLLLREIREQTDLLVVYRKVTRNVPNGVTTTQETEDIYGTKAITDYLKTK